MRLVNELHTIEEEVTDAHGKVISELEAANAVIAKYNEKVAEAEAWRDEVTTDMQSYVDERSDKWQESEAGTEYQEWQDSYAELSFETLEELVVTDLPEFALAQQIEDLTDQPG
jgi:hypothetical protein